MATRAAASASHSPRDDPQRRKCPLFPQGMQNLLPGREIQLNRLRQHQEIRQSQIESNVLVRPRSAAPAPSPLVQQPSPLRNSPPAKRRLGGGYKEPQAAPLQRPPSRSALLQPDRSPTKAALPQAARSPTFVRAPNPNAKPAIPTFARSASKADASPTFVRPPNPNAKPAIPTFGRSPSKAEGSLATWDSLKKDLKTGGSSEFVRGPASPDKISAFLAKQHPEPVGSPINAARGKRTQVGVVHTSANALGIKSSALITEAHDVFGAIDKDYSGTIDMDELDRARALPAAFIASPTTTPRPSPSPMRACPPAALTILPRAPCLSPKCALAHVRACVCASAASLAPGAQAAQEPR